MIVSANRLRSIGWIGLLLVCFALVMVMAFRVNGLRSQVHRAEERIVALKQEKVYLETEMETRANQQQLKTWNDVEFGYVAPGADQYLENERQLAALSKPDEVGAPAPIRVASTDDNVVAAAAFPAMVSPISGQPTSADDADRPAHLDHATATAALGDSLGKVRHFADDAADDAPATVNGKASGKAKKPERSARADSSIAPAKHKDGDRSASDKSAAGKPKAALATKSGEKSRAGASASASASSKSAAKAKSGQVKVASTSAKPNGAHSTGGKSSGAKSAGAHATKLARTEPHKSDPHDRAAPRGPIKIALKDAKLAK